MKKQICKQFTITCRGKSDADIELAFEEATSKIKEGYQSGRDSNDDGAFFFMVNDDVQKELWPA